VELRSLTKKFDLVVAGHLAIDNIEIGKTRVVRVGGPPFYSAIAASRLGVKVAVLSKVGGDFSRMYLEILENEQVNIDFTQIVENAKTTSFHIKYINNFRKMKLEALCHGLLPEDVSTKLKAKAVHIAPIANEVSYETFERLRKNADIVCLDPQGFTRRFDEKRNVELKEWRDKRFLEKTSILKANEKEAACLSGFSNPYRAAEKIAEYGVEMVIVTLAEKGAILYCDGKIHEIPAYPVRVADLTGAGDVFMGVFIAEYIKGKDPAWCGCVGSAAASILIEKSDLLRFGFKDEIYERAEKLYGMIG